MTTSTTTPSAVTQPGARARQDALHAQLAEAADAVRAWLEKLADASVSDDQVNAALQRASELDGARRAIGGAVGADPDIVPGCDLHWLLCVADDRVSAAAELADSKRRGDDVHQSELSRAIDAAATALSRYDAALLETHVRLGSGAPLHGGTQ